MSAPLLQLAGLTVEIGGTVLVDGLDLAVGQGETLGIVGESGSGKSLTLRALLRLLPEAARVSGQVLWQGQNVLALAPEPLRKLRGAGIGMIFQEPMTALDPVLTIGLQITESLGAHLGLRGGAAQRRAVELLDLVGIPDAKRRLGNYPHEFSGGMRQRAMIAIALAASPKLLLADEPTTALDVTIQDQILKLLLQLQDDLGMSIILVTHDLGVVAETCDRVAVMYAGRIMESGPVTSVFRAPAHAYTLGLMRSVPDGSRRRQALSSIPGMPPNPRALPPGCRFAPRCGFAEPACTQGSRSLAPVDPQHLSACLRVEAVRDATLQAAMAPP